MEISIEDAFRGTTLELNLSMPEVDGAGRVRRVPHPVKARIPPGATDGQRLRIPGKGGKGAGGARDGDLFSFDPASRRVTRDGQPVQLTAREFDLLRYLLANAGRVVSRERLLNGVWRLGYDPGTKIVDVYVRYLRAKIDTPDQPSLIETVRGIGYMMPLERN